MQKGSVDKRLRDELEKYFEQKGVRGAVVNVKNNNPVGVRFVEGIGFKETESCA